MQSEPGSRSQVFRQQYTEEFVDRWDELIGWESRQKSENSFFQRILADCGVHRVLDIACGTGYHTITLSQSGFDVTGADGSPRMVARSRQNAKELGLGKIRFFEAEWSRLSEVFFDAGHFDAVICLGNALTHLFEESERIHLLEQVYTLLKPGGIAVIDQRNYDTMLDRGAAANTPNTISAKQWTYTPRPSPAMQWKSATITPTENPTTSPCSHCARTT